GDVARRGRAGGEGGGRGGRHPAHGRRRAGAPPAQDRRPARRRPHRPQRRAAPDPPPRRARAPGHHPGAARLGGGGLKAVKRVEEMRLRVSIHADDPEVVSELRRLLEEAGHEVVGTGFAPARDTDALALLTPRELEVLGAIAEGLTNKAIARRL